MSLSRRHIILGAAGGAAPSATNVGFAGIEQVGQELTGSYIYNPNGGGVESGTTFQWYVADDALGTNEVPIVGATSINYTLLVADETKFIRFGVTPSDGVLTGDEAFSAYSGAIAAAPFTPADLDPQFWWSSYVSFVEPGVADNTNVSPWLDQISNRGLFRQGGTGVYRTFVKGIRFTNANYRTGGISMTTEDPGQSYVFYARNYLTSNPTFRGLLSFGTFDVFGASNFVNDGIQVGYAKTGNGRNADAPWNPVTSFGTITCTTTTANYKGYFNKTLDTTINFTGNRTGSGGLGFGHPNLNTTTADGDVRECIFFNREISQSEVNQIVDWFSSVYA